MCWIATVSARSGNAPRHEQSPIASPGTSPVPAKRFFAPEPSTRPNSLACTMSRVVSLVLPATHAATGRSNRRPAHHGGYSPVRCSVVS